MKSTFKKSLFFAAWCVAFIFGTVAFHSCSNEDLDEDSVQSKAELFRAKAKELSKKYGVDVTLNEENIEKMAETLTMEQFEKEFQMFATMKIDTILLVESTKNEMPKKLRLKTKKRLAETQEELNRNKVYEGSMDVENKTITIYYDKIDPMTQRPKRTDAKYSVSGTATWRFQQSGSSYVDVKLDFSGSPTAEGGGRITISSGTIINGKLSFNVSGPISMRSSLFSRFIQCSVNYDESSGIKKASVSA